MFYASNEKRHLYEGLTRHNYFPNQKEGARELPPCFSTIGFTPEIVELLVDLPEIGAEKSLDMIRFNIQLPAIITFQDNYH